MAYNAIQPAAFVADPSAGPFRIWQHTLAFPAAWRAPVLALYRHGKKEQTQEKLKEVPIKRLNAVMRALAPDLVAIDGGASFDDTKPWLYAEAPYPQSVMDRFVNAWLRNLQPSAEAYPLFRETAQALRAHRLEWTPREVDLLEQDISGAGTALPAERLYRLLPEILAARIVQLPPYEHLGERVTFHRVAVDPRANGAELMSWPPLEHTAKSEDGSKRTWHYSGVLKVSLRTVPFSPVPRIHISTGIRRWVTGPVFMPARTSVSTYLLTDASLVADAPTPNRFAVAKLKWDHKTGKTEWQHGGPEGLLVSMSALDNLPPADVLQKEPETWLAGKGGLEAAVAYHTRMGWHGVAAGLMPAERRRLVEWAAQALRPQLTPAPALRRSDIKPQNPRPLTLKRQSVPKDSTDEQRADVAAANQRIDLRNAELRRRSVAAAVHSQALTVFLLYQSDAMRSHIIHAAESSLGLAAHRVDTGPELWSWQVDGLAVRVHARSLGELGAALGDGDKAPRKGQQLEEAISARRTAVAATVTALSEELAEPAQLTLIELEGPKQFKRRTTDPKSAIRLGCVDAGSVSQFVRPPDLGTDEGDGDDAGFRAAAAWADGLRQTGMRLVPEHTLGNAIPENLNQVAFWIAKRRIDGPTNHEQFTPVAVLIRPGHNTVMGRTADMDQWVPYPDLLKGLAGKLRSDELSTAKQQEAATAAFIRKTLYALRGTPTLVVTKAQNIRYRWPWQQNSTIMPDRVQIGGGPLQRLALHGKQLEVVPVFVELEVAVPHLSPAWW